MRPIIDIDHVSKRYDSGTVALNDVSLQIDEGEILALLGPNGAGKTTLISIICGLVVPTGGTVRVGGHDIRKDWRAARKLIGLVPQEIALEPFESVIDCVRFTRGLYGEPPDDAYIERLLSSLALWDKREAKTRELSGGMKRRVLIAKALSHRPKVLFLDEPTAGVDVALRREMWQVVRELRAEGVTIILTTHYLEEAEDMADRIGVINRGELLLVKSKDELLGEFGKKHLTVSLYEPLRALPAELAGRGLVLSADGRELGYAYDTRAERTGIAHLLAELAERGIAVRDVSTKQSSLEEIFMSLVEEETA
ncbi:MULTISPECIES: ABC transporter ATP-binding protein [Paracoccus]|jgi:ABC-2 type transport system ATP-binding protein|uniref:ABC transporter related protein n=1 Tax=Paracoccus denitrificans (strain Pd 1222) TaxID=318586 RepID=A1B3L2_PARDP|nr:MULTISPECIES: ABC transporter ATP-binding protein [Paracoccus]ABL70106.1 ABC transporter related protein [Paracoccus denitrificans PD1222]MBB4628823.1 ABC-2 type transport system ATP-binding protein [Paracoccus denitrificans]MCU7429794.1 ABC transporter ATP-binding protein [Paracoccus denitrificans]MDK8874514.1 ABC transporter ATP-binding protein [Paracoccus sp. SSJ]QAR25479.1 ABC transporter ATP-binding protein [Paracoccus denitrificans]